MADVNNSDYMVLGVSVWYSVRQNMTRLQLETYYENTDHT